MWHDSFFKKKNQTVKYANVLYFKGVSLKGLINAVTKLTSQLCNFLYFLFLATTIW